MKREEVRDRVPAPLLPAFGAGGRSSRLLVNSMEAVGERSHQLMCGGTVGQRAAFGEALLASALCGYQIWGRSAQVAEQGMRVILRQVEDGAGRLAARWSRKGER